MIHFLGTEGQAFTVREYIEGRGRPLADRIRFVDYASLPATTHFERGTYVLSGLDQLSQGMLRFITGLHVRLSLEPGLRFLNHPTRTLRRFELLDTLWTAGRNEFRAVRATDDFSSLRYPVFVRSEWLHDGNISPLLRSPIEVSAAIGRALVQGHRVRDLLVVDFCSTADSVGLYRKYAAFIVGKRVLSRSVSVSREWMIKGRGTELPRAVIEEDRAYALGNPHQAELTEIFAIAGVEYGRIDYAVRDGRIQTWEINLAPTIYSGAGRSSRDLPEELRQLRMESRDHFFRGFQAAWEAVDISADGSPAIAVAFGDATRREALKQETRESAIGRLRKRLGPLDRLIRPAALLALPAVGWMARRFPPR